MLKIASEVVKGKPPPLSSLRHAVPAHLEHVCRQAMMKNPARRFAGAEALAEALEKPLDTPSLAREKPPSSRTRVQPPKKRERKASPLVIAGVVAGGILALVLAGLLIFERGGAAESSSEEAAVADATDSSREPEPTPGAPEARLPRPAAFELPETGLSTLRAKVAALRAYLKSAGADPAWAKEVLAAIDDLEEGIRARLQERIELVRRQVETLLESELYDRARSEVEGLQGVLEGEYGEELTSLRGKVDTATGGAAEEASRRAREQVEEGNRAAAKETLKKAAAHLYGEALARLQRELEALPPELVIEAPPIESEVPEETEPVIELDGEAVRAALELAAGCRYAEAVAALEKSGETVPAGLMGELRALARLASRIQQEARAQVKKRVKLGQLSYEIVGADEKALYVEADDWRFALPWEFVSPSTWLEFLAAGEGAGEGKELLLLLDGQLGLGVRNDDPVLVWALQASYKRALEVPAPRRAERCRGALESVGIQLGTKGEDFSVVARALEAFAAGDPDEALRELKGMSSDEPEGVVARYLRGMARRAKGLSPLALARNLTKNFPRPA